MRNRINQSQLYLLAWIIAGVVVITSITSFLVYKTPFFWIELKTRTFISLSILIYLLFSVISLRINRFSYREQLGIVLFVLTVCMSLFLTVIAIGRLYYSRSYLIYQYAFSFIWIAVGFYLFKNPKNSFFLLCPWGLCLELSKNKGRNWKLLESPELQMCDGIIADLHEKIEPDWMRLIANAALTSIPVYHAASIYEKTTGRVSTRHINEGILSNFKVNQVYFRIKIIFEKIIILLLSPVFLLTGLLVALVIRIDSKGPVLFVQERTGRKGKPFKMYKFRTMTTESEKDGAKFTTSDDKRITKVGKILRKFRIDEIPQFYNILKGEMSLIGPRPEQVVFSKNFEKEIPYYAYRNMVNPGISGWAQVAHGYAAGVEETLIKLEYDLYYIKYMGFWLDFLITVKTLKTILTGFGSK